MTKRDTRQIAQFLRDERRQAKRRADARERRQFDEWEDLLDRPELAGRVPYVRQRTRTSVGSTA